MTDETENWLRMLHGKAIDDADRIDRLTAAAARHISAREDAHVELDEFTRVRLRASVVSAVRSENQTQQRQCHYRIPFPAFAAAAALVLTVAVVLVSVDKKPELDLDLDGIKGTGEHADPTVKRMAIPEDRWPSLKERLLIELDDLAIPYELLDKGAALQFQADARLVERLVDLSPILPIKLQAGTTYRMFIQDPRAPKYVDPLKQDGR